MDALYVVGPGGRSEELRYSLRALAAHLPVDRVFIAGHRPPWVRGIEHVISPDVRGQRYDNIRRAIVEACSTSDLSAEFVYLNDDFFVLEPMGCVPVLHRGKLRLRARRSPSTGYGKGIVNTVTLLQAWGFADPLDYELHCPMIMDRPGVLAVAERLAQEGREHARTHSGLQMRSLYGNLSGIGGAEVADMKLHGREAVPKDVPFISSSDASFRAGPIGPFIRKRFPDPSPYEEDAV